MLRVKFSIYRFLFSENYQEIKKTPEGALEWTMKYCLGITSMVAPDAIIIYNRLISKSDDVKKKWKNICQRVISLI